jgi:hypothetical protein
LCARKGGEARAIKKFEVPGDVPSSKLKTKGTESSVFNLDWNLELLELRTLLVGYNGCTSVLMDDPS